MTQNTTPTPDESRMPSSSERISVEPLSGQISSWRDFGDRAIAAMAMAASDPCDLTLTDHDFLSWPLGSRAMTEAFHQWVMASARHHRCVLLAANYDRFESTHPRWVMWRQKWMHRVACLQAEEEQAEAVPTLLLLHGRLALRILNPLSGTGIWTREPTVINDWLNQVDVILQRSHQGLGSKTLGL